MTLRDFQVISNFQTGATYFYDIIKYFGIDTNLDVEVVDEIAANLIKMDPIELPKNQLITINNKLYKYEKDFNERKAKIFERFDALKAQNDHIANAHFLLACYLRPAKRKLFKYVIEPFDPNTQDKIANELLNMEAGLASSLLSFFLLSAQRYSINGNVYFLNRMKRLKLLAKK